MSATYRIDGHVHGVTQATTKRGKPGHIITLETGLSTPVFIKLWTTDKPPEIGTKITAAGNITQYTNPSGYRTIQLGDATIRQYDEKQPELTPINPGNVAAAKGHTAI